MHLNKSRFWGWGGVGVDENDLTLTLHCLDISQHCPLFRLSMGRQVWAHHFSHCYFNF